MSIVVTGSIATDHLMVFPGRFREQLIEGQLDHVSLSFLVDELTIFRGGIAANIALGLGHLGLRPVLLGAVGQDFADYRGWLTGHGVDCDHVLVSATQHTARFLCTTDADHNQIASFYAGAMSEARDIDLAAVMQQLDAVELVIICPDDPEAMLRHTRTCRALGVPFAADPSQQIARMEGPALRDLVEGAAYLLTNEYERDLLQQKTGWSTDEVRARVGTWITTRGKTGAELTTAGVTLAVHAPVERRRVDPTGVGDGFRAGFLAGRAWGLGLEPSAQIGCMMATLVIEATGPQEYAFEARDFLDRYREAYGADSAADVELVLLAQLDPSLTAR